MCRSVTCRTCGKTTWAGCGMHVDQARRGGPAAQRCPGHPKSERPGGGFSPASSGVPDTAPHDVRPRSAAPAAPLGSFFADVLASGCWQLTWQVDLVLGQVPLGLARRDAPVGTVRTPPLTRVPTATCTGGSRPGWSFVFDEMTLVPSGSWVGESS